MTRAEQEIYNWMYEGWDMPTEDTEESVWSSVAFIALMLIGQALGLVLGMGGMAAILMLARGCR